MSNQLATLITVLLLVSTLRPLRTADIAEKNVKYPRTRGRFFSLASPLFKSFVKDTLAYLAAPVFMPIAISRTLLPPPGLGPDSSPIQKFAKYAFKLATMRRNDAEEQLKQDLFHLLTSHRRNTVLTMKQYRQLERSEKSAKSLRKNHRKLNI